MEFKTLAELEKYLLKQISDSLKTEVALDSRDLMREHIQDDVYSQYRPSEYERTFELINSCETSMETSDTLKLTNARKGDEGEDVPNIIEYGKGYKWGYIRNLDEIIGPRPFIKNTFLDLRSGKAKVFLGNALHNRGFKIEG